MDLNWLMQRIPMDNFQRFTIQTDVDPADEKTPGWTADVLLSEELGETFIGFFAETPSKALEGLIDNLGREGYLKVEDVYELHG